MKHDKDECKITNADEKTALKCANCGESGHPASYKVCKYYKNALKIIKEQKNEKRKDQFSKINRADRYTDPNLLYTAALLQRQTQGQHINPPIINPPFQNVNHTPKQNETTDAPQWAKELLGQLATVTQRLVSLENLISQNIY